MDTVYIETSIVSHATARPSSDVAIAALQQQAQNWWAIERPKFELVTSQSLLTLNCRHIANAHQLPRVYRLLDERGFGQLLVCTPAEFLGGGDDDDEEPDT